MSSFVQVLTRLYLVELLSSTHLMFSLTPASTSVGCGSLSGRVTQTFIPERLKLVAVMSKFNCYHFPFTLITVKPL